MHPLRTLWEWYNIVHETPLIKNQNVNARYLGTHPPFWMDSKLAATKIDKIYIKCYLSLLSSGLLTFMT